MKIALDAMGGDFGPPYLVAGAVMALREYSHIKKLFLVGDTKQIESELKKHKCNDRRIHIVHSTQVEDVKGTEKTKEVFKMLKKTSLNFRGNIEGRHLFEDPVEVVVCDGFVGNVILKTCESIAVAIFKWLKHELARSPRRKAGAFLAKDAFL